LDTNASSDSSTLVDDQHVLKANYYHDHVTPAESPMITAPTVLLAPTPSSTAGYHMSHQCTGLQTHASSISADIMYHMTENDNVTALTDTDESTVDTHGNKKIVLTVRVGPFDSTTDCHTFTTKHGVYPSAVMLSFSQSMMSSTLLTNGCITIASTSGWSSMYYSPAAASSILHRVSLLNSDGFSYLAHHIPPHGEFMMAGNTVYVCWNHSIVHGELKPCWDHGSYMDPATSTSTLCGKPRLWDHSTNYLDPASCTLHGELITRYWKIHTTTTLLVYGEQIRPLDLSTNASTFIPQKAEDLTSKNSVDDSKKLDPHSILHGDAILSTSDEHYYWDSLILHGEFLPAHEVDPLIAHAFDWGPSFLLDGEIQFFLNEEEEIVFENTSTPYDRGILATCSSDLTVCDDDLVPPHIMALPDGIHTEYYGQPDPPSYISSSVVTDEKHDIVLHALDLVVVPVGSNDGVYYTPRPSRDHKNPLPPAEPPPEDPPPPAEPPPSPMCGNSRNSNASVLDEEQRNGIKHDNCINTGTVEKVMLAIMEFTKSWSSVNKNFSQYLVQVVLQPLIKVMLHGEILLLELVHYMNGDGDVLLNVYEERKQRQDVHIKFKRGTCYCFERRN
jgi:hypothetical protein